MKHNFIRKVISVMLSCSVMVLGSANVSSEDFTTSDTLGIYERKFEQLNEKYGTDFQIATFNMTEAELNDLLASYLNMTDEEFEAYFLDMKEKSERFLKEQQEQSQKRVMYKERTVCSPNEMSSDGNISFCKGFVKDVSLTSPQGIKYAGYNAEKNIMKDREVLYSPNVEELQHYYYSDNNFFWIYASVNYSAGWGQYIELLAGGSAQPDFPAYIVDENLSINYNINSYYQKCDAVCAFPCYYYPSKGVVSGSLQYKTYTFTAGWGDVKFA